MFENYSYQWRSLTKFHFVTSVLMVASLSVLFLYFLFIQGAMMSGKKFPKSRKVTTTCGKIVGRRLIYTGAKQVDAFQGIPYATPPVGELRFQKPLPPKPWKGLKKTQAFGPRCIQKDFPGVADQLGPTSEDCLTLNVFTPVWEPEDDNGFPVMIYVPGGAYVSDSAVKYGDINICQNLVTKDVVVVTVQYRLGYLGLYSTGDRVCPGNQLLWDVAMALQWVKDNIARFNGDPDNITLFGQSAGGAIVDMLSLSPYTRDLFHKVASMAGTASNEWALSKILAEACRNATEGWGVTSFNSSEEVLDQLRLLPANTFAMSVSLAAADIPLETAVAPWVDGDFLPKHPSELRKEAPLKPRIVGLTNYEGLIYMMRGPEPPSAINETAAILFPENKHPLNYENMQLEYIDRIGDVENDTQRQIADAYGDRNMAIGHQRCVQECVKRGDVYFYRFDHYNPDMYGPLGLNFPFKEATHCGDIAFVLGKGIIWPFTFNSVDNAVLDEMSTYFTNFAKYGNPNTPGTNETWLPATEDAVQRNLEIGVESKMSESFYNGRPLWCVEEMKKRV